eukprot:TRINITY_DN17027_c0_g2_i1.p1 TRINITY_DN17027_c0_g2~~TRINITY_DN17027_c0_g2_i1.p1  ORF type:complete len:311 (+),score=79.91 TRINITY_DN17027_c0_g2_i1:32-934(+)
MAKRTAALRRGGGASRKRPGTAKAASATKGGKKASPAAAASDDALRKLPPSLPRRRSALVARCGGLIAGVDEAGRGPWAGPVVAAAVAVRPGVQGLDRGILDSKALGEPQRELLFQRLTRNPAVVWSAAVVSHGRIDKVNILRATHEGMARAGARVAQKATAASRRTGGRGAGRVAKFLVDGNSLPPQLESRHACEAVIKGDATRFVIAAASIIAKVTRDRLMARLHKRYPQYKFDENKGYGVAAHAAALRKFGVSPVHRRSYAPVKAELERQQRRKKRGATSAPAKKQRRAPRASARAA